MLYISEFLIQKFPSIVWSKLCQWKVKPWSNDWLIAAGAYPCLCSMKPLVVFLLPLDWVLVSPTIHTPSSIYTPGRREALREYIKEQNLTMSPTRVEPRPLALESSALIMKPRCLPSCVNTLILRLPTRLRKLILDFVNTTRNSVVRKFLFP